MKKLVISLLGASALAAASAANAQIVVNFNSPTGDLGPTEVYSTGAGNIIASGFSNADTPTDLFGKNAGPGENGLGLQTDPTGNNEIYDPTGFVQLDLSGLSNVSAVQFFMGSTTNGEGWAVYGTDTAGCHLLGAFCGTLLNTGNTENWNTLNGFNNYNYYDFYATGGAPNNVLLGGLSLAVPEPATWAMMLLGFGAIGMAARRNRKVGLAQLA